LARSPSSPMMRVDIDSLYTDEAFEDYRILTMLDEVKLM
jgi:hypothetical protein